MLRTKEYLVAVRAKGDLLALTTMRFQREIRPTGELDLPTRKRPGKAKVDRAVALVEALAADFDHSAYKDRYRSGLRKLTGLDVTLPMAPDVASALDASDGAEPRSAT